MDSFVTKVAGRPHVRKLNKEPWGMGMREINGKFSGHYKHRLLQLLTGSMEELCAVDVVPEMPPQIAAGNILGREWVSFVNFDSKGIYLASVTNKGWIYVHDFERLYSQIKIHEENGSEHPSGFSEPLLQICNPERLDVVRWNPTNQDEVGCVAERSNKVILFDITYVSTSPSEVLTKTPKARSENLGFSDLALSSSNKNRVFACGLDGAFYQWDRRTSKFSSSIMPVPCSSSRLNSLQLTSDEQIAFLGCENGCIYAMDLRGGKSSIGLQFLKETHLPPLYTWKVSTLLEDIFTLKAQTQIVRSGIQSIDFDPSYGCQLAFHLNNGWSGVLNLITSTVTHIHCPPPPWINDECMQFLYKRKPTWLAMNSIFAVGASLGNGINILDFNPYVKSSCRVTNDSGEMQDDMNGRSHSLNQCIKTSSRVVACAAHPLYPSIVGGTDDGLVLVSQNSTSSTKELV